MKPTRHRYKTPPRNSDLIQKGNTVHAFLSKVKINPEKLMDKGNVMPLSEQIQREVSIQQQAGIGRYGNKQQLNIKTNDTKNNRFDLWITEASYGYSTIGPSAVSKYYSRTYTHSFRLTPASIKGICRDENEYDDLGDFIREGQIAVSRDHRNVFRLYIPGAKIDYIGVIESFQGGFNANNRGIPLAPRFEFDFTIFKDLNDNVQNFGTTAKTIIYNFDTDAYWVQNFNNYKKDYIVGALIDETLNDKSRNEINGFNRSLYTSAQSAAKMIEKNAKSAAQNIGDFAEGVSRTIDDLGNDIGKALGRLF